MFERVWADGRQAAAAFARCLRRRRGGIWFDGDYRHWDAAAAEADGYDDPRILERVRDVSRKVRDDRNWFERDGVLFDSPQWNFPLIACLLRIASQRSRLLCVLDIGGSLGSVYYQSREFLQGLPQLRWRVVEQPHFAACGRAEFQTETLRFYDDIASALADGPADVALLSGVLPYVRETYSLLSELAEAGIAWLLLDRTPIWAGDRDRLVVQHVPQDIYGHPVRYPAWIFSADRLRDSVQQYWPIVVDTGALDGTMAMGRKRIDFRLILAGPHRAAAK